MVTIKCFLPSVFLAALVSCANLVGLAEFEDSDPESNVVRRQVFDANDQLIGDLIGTGLNSMSVISPNGFYMSMEYDGGFFVGNSTVHFASTDCTGDNILESSEESFRKQILFFNDIIHIPRSIEDGFVAVETLFNYESQIFYNSDMPTCQVNSGTLEFYNVWDEAELSDLGIADAISGPLTIR